ncbi:MAG: hypothetical protein HC817_05615 [Saprospiraceae bacterium]|nr:hypothetical protein [Saprospiraceae bacterium]
MNKARLKFGKYDANFGLILRGDGQGDFSSIPQNQTGLKIVGDVRGVLTLKNKLLVGINQMGVRVFEF